MKSIRKLLRCRRGVSLSEVVVAMAVVLMVAGAAISVLIYSSKADAVFRDRYRALTACENAVECIRFADGTEDVDTLKTALEKVGFENPSDDGTDTYYLVDNDQVVVICDFENAHYVVQYGDDIIYTTN